MTFRVDSSNSNRIQIADLDLMTFLENCMGRIFTAHELSDCKTAIVPREDDRLLNVGFPRLWYSFVHSDDHLHEVQSRTA